MVGDQIPLEGWTLYLTEGGVRQLLGRHTGPDGCTTWGALRTATRVP
jgi:hypothetical protein